MKPILEQSRFAQAAIFLICLVTLWTSVSLLYRDDPVSLRSWGQGQNKDERWEAMLKELKNHVEEVVEQHDEVTKQFLKLEQQKDAEKQRENERQGEGNKQNQEEDKKKQEEDRKKQEEERKKQEEENKKKEKEEAERKAKEDAKNQEHARLEKIFKEMSDREEMHLLRDIDVGTDKPQPRGDKIVLVSGNDQNSRAKNKTRFNQVMKNRDDFCKYNGYKHEFVDTTPFPLNGLFGSWNKVPALRQAFDANPQAEWFWWLDTDAIIMNEKLDLAKHILHPKVMEERITWGRPVRDKFYKFIRCAVQKGEVDVKDIDVLITQDNMGWNAGSMFFRNTPQVRWLLDMWDIQVFKELEWWQAEQSAFTQIVISNDNLFKKVGTMPQRLFNAYFAEHWKYVTGDLVLHFAGVVKNMKEYNGFWEEQYNNRIKAYSS